MKDRVVAALAALALAVLCSVTVSLDAHAATAQVSGPDVSAYQPSVDFKKVAKAGHQFAFAKASEGLTYRDPSFARHWKAIQAAGLIPGAYHFARPQPGRTGAQEARFFVASMRAAGAGFGAGTLPPVLDLEAEQNQTPAQMRAYVRSFVATVKAETGRQAIIYTGAYFWADHVGCHAGTYGAPLWLAAYTARPVLPCGWSTYAFWQYTDRGDSGDGPSDMSVFRGSLAELRTLAQVPADSGSRPPTIHKLIPVECVYSQYLGHGSSGVSVRTAQRHLRARGFLSVHVTGYYDAATVNAVRRLQAKHPRLGSYGVPDGIVGPKSRGLLRLHLCKRPGQRYATTVALDGTPTFRGLALALRDARRHGWHGTLVSSDRRKGVAEKYGRSSQASLYACWVARQRGCNPANPPGRSTHELRSDGVAYAGPPGRVLHWWQLGLDVTDNASAVHVLRALGYDVRRPYSSGSEAHHLNFYRSPVSTEKRRGVR